MSNNPVMWVIRAAVLMVLLLFAVYFVCVQINAIAYLAGKHSAVIGGVKPPAPIDSDTAATINIVVGLIFEAVVALIVAIVSAITLTSLRDARRLADSGSAGPVEWTEPVGLWILPDDDVLRDPDMPPPTRPASKHSPTS